MIDRMGDAEQLAVERVDGRERRLAAAAGATGPPADDRLERDRPDAGRQRAERVRPARQADEVQQRDARHDAERRVERVADRLGAVGGRRRTSHRLARRPAAAIRVEQRAPDPAPPGPRAGRSTSTGTTAARARTRGGERDDQPRRSSASAVATTNRSGSVAWRWRVQPQQRADLVGDVGLVEPRDVVVDAVRARSRRTRRQLVGADGPVGQRDRRPAHARRAPDSSPSAVTRPPPRCRRRATRRRSRGAPARPA